MTCAHCRAVETTFDARSAKRRRKRMHRDGLDKTTRWLVEAIEASGVTGLTVMDIGGGLGGITCRLLEAGAESAIMVEASSAFLDAAQSEAAERGLNDRVAWRHGDFVELAPELEPADIVCLDRVICCYPDMPRLVDLSSARAGRLYGLVVPRWTWWTRLGARVINSGMWLGRNAFRVFVHPPEVIEGIAESHGLEEIFRRQEAVWRVMVFRRVRSEGFAPAGVAG